MTPEEANELLWPLSMTIQVCPKCGKSGVYKNDKHKCK